MGNKRKKIDKNHCYGDNNNNLNKLRGCFSVRVYLTFRMYVTLWVIFWVMFLPISCFCMLGKSNYCPLSSWLFEKHERSLSRLAKKSNQLVDNYCTVSLLPFCWNIFEELIFDSVFNFMIQNNLLKGCQLGFRPKGSYVN